MTEPAATATYLEAAAAADVQPGKMRCVELRGRRILLCNVAGQYYATDDTCTHEDASLATGSLREGLVKCPLHGSRFDVRTGAVLDEPATENLRIYAVKVEHGRILVAIP